MSTFIACSKSSHYCYTTFLTKTATPCLQAVRIGVLARRPGSILVRFVVDRVALGQICLQYLFSPVSMIPPMLPIDLLFFFFFFARQPLSGPRPPHSRGYWTHTTTHHSRQDSSRRVINPSQRPLPDNTHIHTTDKHPCTRWDSNPQSQQASGRRPTPQTAQALEPTFTFYRHQIISAINSDFNLQEPCVPYIGRA